MRLLARTGLIFAATIASPSTAATYYQYEFHVSAKLLKFSNVDGSVKVVEGRSITGIYTIEFGVYPINFYGYYAITGNKLSFDNYHGENYFADFYFDSDLNGDLPTTADGFLLGSYHPNGGKCSCAEFYREVGDIDHLSVRVYDAPAGEGWSYNSRTISWSAIPEPATWAMMITGFGAAGYAARRRRSIASVSFA
jgi:hypothetical protein